MIGPAHRTYLVTEILSHITAANSVIEKMQRVNRRTTGGKLLWLWGPIYGCPQLNEPLHQNPVMEWVKPREGKSTCYSLMECRSY